jgi:hypothetical protein
VHRLLDLRGSVTSAAEKVEHGAECAGSLEADRLAGFGHACPAVGWLDVDTSTGFAGLLRP